MNSCTAVGAAEWHPEQLPGDSSSLLHHAIASFGLQNSAALVTKLHIIWVIDSVCVRTQAGQLRGKSRRGGEELQNGRASSHRPRDDC